MTMATVGVTSAVLGCALIMIMVVIVIMSIGSMRVSLSLFGIVSVLGQMIMSIVTVVVIVLLDRGPARSRGRVGFGVRSQLGSVACPTGSCSDMTSRLGAGSTVTGRWRHGSEIG